MARIVLVLICGALVFILVSKFAPHFIETYLPSASSESTTTSPEATDSSKPTTTKKGSATQKAKAGGTTSKTASAAPNVSELSKGVPASPAMGLGTPVPPPHTPAEASRSVARVTSENATLYLTNTSAGPVVGRLTRGAVVETVFVVSSAGQNWTFVNAGDQQIAGFLRSETLAKPRPADQPGR
jgi:hypothetical protein